METMVHNSSARYSTHTHTHTVKNKTRQKSCKNNAGNKETKDDKALNVAGGRIFAHRAHTAPTGARPHKTMFP